MVERSKKLVSQVGGKGYTFRTIETRILLTIHNITSTKNLPV